LNTGAGVGGKAEMASRQKTLFLRKKIPFKISLFHLFIFNFLQVFFYYEGSRYKSPGLDKGSGKNIKKQAQGTIAGPGGAFQWPLTIIQIF